jgi:hypothetical protein
MGKQSLSSDRTRPFADPYEIDSVIKRRDRNGDVVHQVWAQT